MTNTFSENFGEQWVRALVELLSDQADYLGELDKRAGDGDFGTNLSTAMKLSRKNIEEMNPRTYNEWVSTVSRGFLGVGGTSGPLFGMYFRDLSKATENQTPTIEELAQAIVQALKTNQHYGGAEVGHKTMVDALSPAADAAASVSGDDASALEKIARAAVDGAVSTRDITASKGRASYIGEAARGVMDPGAAALALTLQALAATASGGSVATDWLK